ncbi:DNA adenine methylase [Nocardia wallacei]|uniref:DNA adenine methylase n=1 Tax=Nocardia wallacei TaxID=480035 RepID=UPI002458A41B|nr:DNA adenine methylase [Nocardia wallacei]
MTVDTRDRTPASSATPISVGRTARKIDSAPREITHPLALGRYQSPLRYPGAKSGLSKVISELILAAQQSAEVKQVDLLVEPFAGGASTTLRLLGAGTVERALLADADPMVAAFWQVAASRTQELIDRITDEHATYVAVGGSVALGRWDYWRKWAARPGTTRATKDLELATKCMFLNRTTFSGILHGQAGPIGGRAQTSAYDIGCRFNLPDLINRLEFVGHLYDAKRLVDVWQSDWKSTLHGVASHYKTLLPNRVIAYLDPPYLSKSGKLYPRSFDTKISKRVDDLDWMAGLQHHRLAEYLRRDMQYRWILSYDNDDRLLSDPALYAARAMNPDQASRELNGVKSWRISKRVVTLNYTASSRTGRGLSKELLITTLPWTTVPTNERLEASM